MKKYTISFGTYAGNITHQSLGLYGRGFFYALKVIFANY